MTSCRVKPTNGIQTRRPFTALVVAVLLVGVADSSAGPYLVLFGADRLDLSPIAIGAFVSVTAVSGMVVSTFLGHRYDRRPGRGPVLIAIAAPTIGYLLLPAIGSYLQLLAVAAFLLGPGAAAFPQLFALARDHLPGSRRGTPALRSVWSLAWAVGPLLGAHALGWHGFAALFVLTAASFALVALPLSSLPAVRAAAPAPAPSPPAGRLDRSVLAAVVGLALFHTAMFAGSIVLPLYVTRALGHPAGNVGLLFSICAAVEVPAALALIALPARANTQRVIGLGVVFFVLYFVLTATTASMVVLGLAQIARGIAIAVVGALGITHMQNLMPGRPGRATTLFANTATAGSLIAGIAAGGTAQAFGYRGALLFCAALTTVALPAFTTRKAESVQQHADEPQ